MASSRNSDPAIEAIATSEPADGAETPAEFKVTAWLAFLIVKFMVLIVIVSVL